MFLWFDVTPKEACLQRVVVGKTVVDETKPSYKTLLKMLKNTCVLKPRSSAVCKQL